MNRLAEDDMARMTKRADGRDTYEGTGEINRLTIGRRSTVLSVV